MSQHSTGRKFGRSKRGGSMATYNAVRRDLRNKERKVAKHTRAVAKAASQPPAVPRGTRRAKRREDMTLFHTIRSIKQAAEAKERSRT